MRPHTIHGFLIRYKKQWVGYHLLDPRTEKVFYVGITSRALRVRLRGHLTSRNRRNCTEAHWTKIQELWDLGLKPIIKQVTRDLMNYIEARVWEVGEQFKLKLNGIKLTNDPHAVGGGTGIISAEARRKISDKARMRVKSPEECLKISIAAANWVCDEEYKRKISQSMKGRSNFWLKGKPLSLEHREKIGQATKGRKWSPEEREAHKNDWTPERREANSKRMRRNQYRFGVVA